MQKLYPVKNLLTQVLTQLSGWANIVSEGDAPWLSLATSLAWGSIWW